MQQRLQSFVNYTALLAWGLIAVLPFLARIRYVPLPQWFAEAHVIWLLLLTWLLLACNGALVSRLPRVSVWMLILAIVWWVQSIVVPLSFPGLNWAASLGFIAMALLGYVTCSLRERNGNVPLTIYLAWALVIGAILQSLIGLCQVTGWAQLMKGALFYDSLHPTTNIFGHLGQRNQYAHYLSWGALAAGYLYSERKIATRWALPLIFWLALSIGWSGSRTALLYAFVMIVVAGVWHLRLRQPESRRLWIILGLTGASIVAIQLLLPYVNQLMQLHTSASGVERLAAEGGSSMGARRWVEWQKAWLVFQAHPVFGIGWYQFGAQSLALQIRPEFAHAAFNSSLFANSHNLVLQLLAETGFIGTLFVVGGFLWVLAPYFTCRAQRESVLPLSMMGISLVHSMLEYPLWYLYFLAVFVIALSLAPQREPSLNKSFFPRITLPALSSFPVVILIVLAVQGWHLYWEMVNLYSPTRNAERNRHNVARLEQIIETEPMYAFHALNTLDNYIVVNRTDIKQKLVWLDRLAAFRPYHNVMIDKARLEALDGQQQQAEQTLRLALATYPTYAKKYLNYLPANEPAYVPLRQIAQQAYDQLPEHVKAQLN